MTMTPWTPEIEFEHLGDLEVTYSFAKGNYLITDGLCLASCRLICTPRFTTSSGYLFIPGNPQANASGDVVIGSSVLSGQGVNLGPWFTQTNCAIPENDDIIYFFRSGNSQNYNTIDASHITSGSEITIYASVAYYI